MRFKKKRKDELRRIFCKMCKMRLWILLQGARNNRKIWKSKNSWCSFGGRWGINGLLRLSLKLGKCWKRLMIFFSLSAFCVRIILWRLLRKVCLITIRPRLMRDFLGRLMTIDLWFYSKLFYLILYPLGIWKIYFCRIKGFSRENICRSRDLN